MGTVMIEEKANLIEITTENVKTRLGVRRISCIFQSQIRILGDRNLMSFHSLCVYLASSMRF